MAFSEFNIAMVLSASRFTPLMISGGLPPFSRVPKSIRIILLIVVAGVFASTAKLTQIREVDERLVFYILSEIMLGFVFVFSLAMVYGAIDFVGKTIDVHMGFAAVNVFNPFSGQTGSLLGNALMMTLITLLVTLDLHVDLVRIIGISFDFVPLGEVNIALEPKRFIAHLAGIFVMTVMVFIPVFSALFLVDFAIGMVSKSMPQMNVYFVTLPLKIFCGVIFMALTVRSSAPAFVDLAKQTTSFLERL